MRALAAVLLGALMGCGVCSAAAQDEQPQVVNVTAVKNPEIRKYRTVAAGLDAFDEYHQFAPAVPELRFKLEVRGEPPPPGEPNALRLAADDFSLPIAIAPSGHFSIPRSSEAWDADADIVLNRKKNTFRVSVDIRTPGVPANMRRLGDLRLECKVAVAIAKKEAPFMVVATVNTLLLTGDWCGKLTGSGGGMPFLAQQTLASAIMVQGQRTRALQISKREFTVPIGDATWADDAMIELSYAP